MRRVDCNSINSRLQVPVTFHSRRRLEVVLEARSRLANLRHGKAADRGWRGVWGDREATKTPCCARQVGLRFFTSRLDKPITRSLLGRYVERQPQDGSPDRAMLAEAGCRPASRGRLRHPLA